MVRSHRQSRGIWAAWALVLTFVGATLGGAAVEMLTSTAPAEATGQRAISSDAVPLNRLTLAPLVERVAPAVVNIAVLQSSPYAQNPLLRDPYYRLFLGVPDEALAPRISAGSGSWSTPNAGWW
jgi:serine protease DegQ